MTDTKETWKLVDTVTGAIHGNVFTSERKAQAYLNKKLRAKPCYRTLAPKKV